MKKKEEEEKTPPAPFAGAKGAPPAAAPPPQGAGSPPPAGKAGSKRRKPKRIEGPGREPEVPESLDTPAFREAWDDWLADLAARRKKPTAKAAAMHMTKCIEVGPVRAVAMLHMAMEKGWRAPYPREEHRTPEAQRDPVAEERERLARRREEQEQQ